MSEDLKVKLEEILDKEIIINDKKLSESEIKNFENEFQITIPFQYKEFLENYIEMYIKPEYVFPMIEKSTITPKSGYEFLDFLYIGDFIKNAKQHILNYGKEMLPIGEASGDVICIGVEGDSYGKIYYMYHENESEKLDYYLISESFEKFILSFERQEEDRIDLDEVEIELDDDLL